MVKDIFDVKDRIVIITGGLGQLGRQFSLSLADRGAKVAIFDIAADKESVTHNFRKQCADYEVIFLPVDITNRKSLEDGLKRVISIWDVPHALINNAALDSPPNSLHEENGPFESYP
jgi:NAD(P)-dependent dehydrogenase (short-subunit alcohol dehydrogenase family)